MRSLYLVLSIAFALSPTFASADEPQTPASRALIFVENGLLKPLAEHDKSVSRFSRGRPAPRERRAHVEQKTPTLDKAEQPFIAFGVDIRFGRSEWKANDLVGCVYMNTGDVYVKIGDDFRAASYLTGKNSDPVVGVCQAAAKTSS